MKTFVCAIMLIALITGCATSSQQPQASVQAQNKEHAAFGIIAITGGSAIVIAGTEEELDEKEPEPLAPEVVHGWRSNWSVCCRALVKEASKAGLDAKALKACLVKIRNDPSNRGKAILPRGALSTVLDGELVWVIGVSWEMEAVAKEEGTLDHAMSYTFTQKSLRQVAFETCT